MTRNSSLVPRTEVTAARRKVLALKKKMIGLVSNDTKKVLQFSERLAVIAI